MKIQIDMKSALFGLAIGVAAMFAIGADSPSSTLWQIPAQKYQLVTGGTTGSYYAMLVDTQTGKVWGANLPSNWHNDGNFWDPK